MIFDIKGCKIVIDTDVINLVIVLVIFVIEIELNYDILDKKRINYFISSTKAHSSLARARNDYMFKPEKDMSEEENTKDKTITEEVKKLNIRDSSVETITKKIDIYIKSTNYIRLILPILVTLEVMHLILQKFDLSFYEYIYPGFNKFFLIFIIMTILVFFIIIIIIRKETGKYSEYIENNSRIIAKYEYNFL